MPISLPAYFSQEQCTHAHAVVECVSVEGAAGGEETEQQRQWRPSLDNPH